MIDLALSPEDEQKRNQMMQTQRAPLATPQAPQQQKGMGGQMMDMAKQRAMTGVLDAGQGAITSGISSALAPTVASGVEGGAILGAGGAGAGAAMATAIPYVGAGLLAGKALGLFNEGGMVGPLSPQYNAQGTMSKEQAMALMNNQPEPIQTMPPTSMPMMRINPDDLYNEIMAESMTEAAQQAMPMMRPPLGADPLNADKTYSPYDMIRPDNAPNT